MAIAIDSSSSQVGTTVNSLTWSHTCTGSNLVLVVGVAIRRNSGGTVVTPTVTYNGVSMTQINNKTVVDTYNRVTMFRLANPDTGTHNIVASFTDTQTYQAVGGGISLTGCDVDAPDDGTNTANGESTTASVSVTTSNDNSMVIDCCFSQGAVTFTVGASSDRKIQQ